MIMTYTQLDNTYKYSTLADAIYGREVEHFHYSFDKKNFEHLISSLPDNAYKQDIIRRLEETKVQLSNVEAIMAALVAQIDDQDAYDAAVLKAIQKRQAAE
jgi:hypothetical protein